MSNLLQSVKRTIAGLCLLAFLTTFSTTMAHAQTLKETTDWMKSSLAPKGIADLEANGFNLYETNGSRYSESLSLEFNGCSVKVTKDTVLTDFAVNDYHTRYIETFNLSDIDPKTVLTTDVGSGIWRQRDTAVTFSTTNDKKTIHCSAIVTEQGAKFGKDAGCMPADDSDELMRFGTSEYARRFVKAMRHAVTVCGGKASTF